MTWELIGEGGIIDFSEAYQLEGEIAEGQKALMELDLRLPVSQGVAQELEDRLKEAGVEGCRVTTASPLIKIYFTKGFPWLPVIVGVILAMATLVILIIGWRIFKQVVPEGLQPLIGTALIVGGVALAAAILIYAIRRG